MTFDSNLRNVFIVTESGNTVTITEIRPDGTQTVVNVTVPSDTLSVRGTSAGDNISSEFFEDFAQDVDGGDGADDFTATTSLQDGTVEFQFGEPDVQTIGVSGVASLPGPDQTRPPIQTRNIETNTFNVAGVRNVSAAFASAAESIAISGSGGTVTLTETKADGTQTVVNVTVPSDTLSVRGTSAGDNISSEFFEDFAQDVDGGDGADDFTATTSLQDGTVEFQFGEPDVQTIGVSGVASLPGPDQTRPPIQTRNIETNTFNVAGVRNVSAAFASAAESIAISGSGGTVTLTETKADGTQTVVNVTVPSESLHANASGKPIQMLNFVNDGTLILENSSSCEIAGAISGFGTMVLADTTCRGNGTVSGTLVTTDGSTLSAGDGDFGVLTVGNAVFTQGSEFTTTLGATTSGPTYGQLNVNGTLTIENDATFSCDVGRNSGPLPDGTVIEFINADGGVSGNFFELPEGSSFSCGGNNGTVSYSDGFRWTIVVVPFNQPQQQSASTPPTADRVVISILPATATLPRLVTFINPTSTNSQTTQQASQPSFLADDVRASPLLVVEVGSNTFAVPLPPVITPEILEVIFERIETDADESGQETVTIGDQEFQIIYEDGKIPETKKTEIENAIKALIEAGEGNSATEPGDGPATDGEAGQTETDATPNGPAPNSDETTRQNDGQASAAFDSVWDEWEELLDTLAGLVAV